MRVVRTAFGRGRGERASAAVEFALVLPLILIMSLALVQVGLLVKDQLVVLGAAALPGVPCRRWKGKTRSG